MRFSENNAEDREILSKIKGKINVCKKNHQVVFTDFLSPSHIEKCIHLVKENSELDCFTVGGYNEAERNILVLYPHFIMREEIVLPIKAVRISVNAKEADFTHRDVLGAILGLGLKREKIGDILISGKSADVILYKEAAEYISIYLTNISRYSVTCEEIKFEELKTLDTDVVTSRIIVPSLRLDAVLSHALNKSRSAVNESIKSGKIKINHQETQNPSAQLKEGDLLSIRGYGRIRFQNIAGTTKKDRIVIFVNKYK